MGKVVKKVKKAVKKVVKPVTKLAGGLLGADAQAPTAEAAPVPAAPVPAAPVVDVPKEAVETDSGVPTESDRKKARAGGKKSLSVARSSGAGVNI